MLSKSRPTIEPPFVINGVNDSASVFNEYADICIATATSAQLAAIKSSPRQAAGAKPIECNTPSTTPRCCLTSSRALWVCASTVTSNSTTGAGFSNFLAVRCVIDKPRPAPVNTIFAPSCCASCATPKANEASVSTPVITIFFPSRIPISQTVVDWRAVSLSLCNQSLKHTALLWFASKRTI